MEKESHTPPHVLIFPLPVQGHVNSMLKLAELLSLAGLHVTFLNSDYNHDRLVRYTDVQARFARFPGFQFKTITDGLPIDHPHSGDNLIKDMIDAIKSITAPLFKEMLINIRPRVNCIIAEGIMGFAIDIANELGIHIIIFRTISASCFWIYFSLPQVLEASELPIKGNEDMDRLIKNVPGMESFLRCRDLPSFCRASDLSDPNLQRLITQTQKTPRAQAVIVNTFEDLEGPILSHLRTKCPKTYTIGPLHAHLKSKLKENSTSLKSSNSLFEEDRSCLTWLDNQPLQSVIYVSFGSITVLTRDQLMEFWYGLVNSKKRFLWVRRPNSVAGQDGDGQIPVELVEGTKERGHMVGWAPQEEVLAHKAVGGFFTHSGWNSTLESIVAGVPMLCWPHFVDQQLNSRFVGEVWKLGLDMKDLCDRKIVEEMVNDLMVEKRETFMKSTAEMAKLARKSISEGGSSYCNLDRLIEDIKLMSMGAPNC